MRPRSRARLVVTVAAVCAVAFVMLWSLQRRLLYLPGGAPPPVEQVLPGATEVVLETADGLDLGAWWLPADGTTAVVVLPGNAGNRALRAPLARALADHDLSVLLVDYRGYGGNPGAPGQAGLLADARAAGGWVTDQPGVEHLVLYGESLGGAVAVGLAREQGPDALVLRSPFASLADVARAHVGPVPRWLLRDPYPADTWIRDVAAPVLVIVADDDEVVPAGSSRRLHAAANAPKRLVTVDARGHNDPELLDGDSMVRAILTFLEDHGLRGGPPPAP